MICWSKLPNAASKPKRLHLEQDEFDGLFHCPAEKCTHEGFATQRGCRKHVKKKHLWFYYFDTEPDQTTNIEVVKEVAAMKQEEGSRPRDMKSMPSFSKTDPIAKDMYSWLVGTGGGCKSQRQAGQIVGRCLKYLKYCCEDDQSLTLNIVDFGLCSPSLLFKFIDALQVDWQLGHAGRLGYIDAISELVDFRKVSGASSAILSQLSTTEIYMKKVRKTVSKMMRIQWNGDLDIESLEAKGHWATLEEVLEAVGQHLSRYESILRVCKDKESSPSATDLAFATKFVALYLFTKVKGSRPMTYQYMTVDMVEKAKTNGGYIDQRMFKTAAKFGFDSIYLTETHMQVLEGYITHVRPRLHPSCDYVLVTRNGGQHNKLGESMGKLVFDATGKYIHPTRFRQIVETASARMLGSTAQSIISEDQKHSSAVAKMHYQKQRSREVASQAHSHFKELQGNKGTELDDDVRARLSETNSASPQEQTDFNDTSSIEEPEPERTMPKKHVKQSSCSKTISHKKRLSPPRRKKNIPFSPEEDKCIKRGLKRYGFGQWKAILGDKEFKFEKCRTTNSLLSRAVRRFPHMAKK